MKNKTSYWFALVELLVVIAILWILVLWIRATDWNSLSDKQRMIIFANKLVSNIETTRNNSLFWKGIWDSLSVPKKWKIDFFLSWSWWILTSYDLDWEGIWITFSGSSITLENEKFYSIKSLECLDLFSNPKETLFSTWTILIESDKLSLLWCHDTSSKKLRITSGYKSFEESFSINTVNGLIERE